MNANEFKMWLEGFLESKESICKSDVDLIKEKMAQVYPVVANPYPIYTPVPSYPSYPTNPWYYGTGTMSGGITNCTSSAATYSNKGITYTS